MATYEKLKFDIPPYQEGNESDFVFEFDENFPLEDVLDITFQARTAAGSSLISKTMSGGEISINQRTVRIEILPSDTLGKSGAHVYEIDFKNAKGNPFATIGGTFTINKQINTL